MKKNEMRSLEESKTKLQELYSELSKHAQYQTLPTGLANKLDLQFEVNEEWRGDRPRLPLILDYARRNACKNILDVGANTGFFTLSLAEGLPNSKFLACELNRTHAAIITLLSEIGGHSNIAVTDTPAELANISAFGRFDLMLHLNILHHAGHDFDQTHVPNRESFKDYGAEYLSRFTKVAARMVFQMGYNWGGDKSLPLVKREDQEGKIQFTIGLMEEAGWTIEQVAFGKPGSGKFPVEYELVPLAVLIAKNDLQAWLTERYGQEVWSEFYQRPLWFCKAKE
ncbi:MAG: class I SAM-dependent methyltransferase [Flavobacteriales bacterium]